MIADQQQDRDAGRREFLEPPGEFPLNGLRRVPVLVRVAAKQDQVTALGKGAIDHLVEGLEEIQYASRKPRFGVDRAVVLYAEMQVGEMQDFQ